VRGRINDVELLAFQQAGCGGVGRSGVEIHGRSL
jgi:hypothetical protein